ncbi:MAG: choice-of-anchor D domain-containing protein, partial [Bacteroidetes bacterium]|nr:choice-of-anchor D domain-containing protein [Bacteroidota bacterium]
GNVLVGSNPSKTFVVENLGDVDLIVTSTTLTGTNASEFSLDNGGAPFTVFPNESHDVVVSFNPTSVGSKICTLKIDNNDPDSFENPKYVPLTGSGTTGIPVGINPASDFGGCDKDIVIPIVVGDLTGQGIISFQFTVEFDEALLITTIGFDNNADIDFGDWIVQYNASTPGQISVAGFGSTQLRGSGVLLYLLFHTSSDDGFTSPLNFAAFTFNNGTPLASTTNGSITLRCCICGDADGDEEVLAFDAALTLQHVLEIITLENPECVDVDEDGEVLAFDAALILHCVLGLTPPVSTCCSANVTINRAGYLEKVNLNIELKEIQQLHDETIIVLYFTGFNSTEEVSAIQFDLELPNDETDLELFELPEEYFSEINKIENSLYRVGIVNPYGIDASEIKLILKSKIDISSNIFQFSKIYINSRAQNDINTFLPGRFIPEDYNIGAYPNPFNPNTRIIYSIPVKTNVEIKVFDILGREVIKLIDQEFEAGIREVKWDATNRFGLPVSSGTFIITIKTDKFFRAIKISHIK